MNLGKGTRMVFSLAAGGLLLAGLLGLLSGAAQMACADTGALFVRTDGSGAACTQASPCDLTTAIGQATAGDTIYVAQGTYTGSGSAVITITESITLYGGWDGSASGPVVRAPQSYPSTLDGEGQRRVVYISGTITPTLEGFVVTGGNATGLAAFPYNQYAGGGICSQGASPIIVNNVITHNLASTSTATYGRGGGIHLADAAATALISGNLIVSNTASTGWSGYGGGISTYQSDVTIRGNQVLSNTGSTAGYSWGGGLFVSWGEPRVVGNAIRANTASAVSGNGGGLSLDNASARVANNLIADNQAVPGNGGSGGGVHVFYSTPTLDGNRVFSNAAETGGGMIVFRRGPITMTNNIIAHNHAITAGGGIRFRGLNDTELVHGGLFHNTIAENDGAGIYLDQYAVVTLTNNIVVSHTTGIYAASGTTATVDHALFFGNSAGDGGGSGVITSSHEIAGRDPLFVDPAAWDYHLRPGSPAVDAGAPLPWLIADVDGQARPQGGVYDVGADEIALHYTYLPLAIKGR